MWLDHRRHRLQRRRRRLRGQSRSQATYAPRRWWLLRLPYHRSRYCRYIRRRSDQQSCVGGWSSHVRPSFSITHCQILCYCDVRFYLFLAVYSMGVDVAGVVFYSELFPNHIRAKGVCLSMATVALTDLVYLQVTTTAFANIGWRFYLVFIVICGIGVVASYIVSNPTSYISS